MITLTDAPRILERHIDSLGEPPEPFVLPDYLFIEAQADAVFTVRKHTCIAFRLLEPLDGIVGFVLDVDGNVTYPKRKASGPDPLAMVRRE